MRKGDLTAFLTIVGDTHYLDVMPARGEDHGSFLTPLHAILRVETTDDRLTLTPLSYDWFADRLHAGRDTDALLAVFDQKQNVLLVRRRRACAPGCGQIARTPGLGAGGDVYSSETVGRRSSKWRDR